MISKNLSLVGVALAVLAACAPQVETETVTSELAPLEWRTPVVGDTAIWQVGDEQRTHKVVAGENGVMSGASSDGCTWASKYDFSPALEYANCNGYTGTQVISGEGSLFPMQVGATARWEIKGTNTTNGAYDNFRECTVKGTARVTVPAGTFDTYHVNCQERWRVRDFYVSPELQHSVIARNHHKGRNETEIRELVSFTPGAI
jgi:hypothetical protein